MKLPRIPFTPPGEIVPLGLSRFYLGYRLRLPVLVWLRRGYQIEWDEMASGWWRFEICLRIERSSITLRWGWSLLRRIEGSR